MRKPDSTGPKVKTDSARGSLAAIRCFCLLMAAFPVSTIPGTAIPDLSKKTYAKYSGKIGDKYAITMDLTSGKGQIHGNYFYDRYGTQVLICGGISDSGVFYIYACDIDSVSDSFTGTFTSVDTLQGTWKNKRLKVSRPFILTRRTEGVAPVLFEQFGKNQDGKKLYVDVPRIAVADDSVNGRVNREIMHTLMAAINRERGDSTHSYRTIKEFLADFDSLFDCCESGLVEFSATVLTNEQNILALEFSSSSFCHGNAHPSGSDYLVNFDLTTGKKIALRELMAPRFRARLNRIGNKWYNKDYCKECHLTSYDAEYPGAFKLNDNFAITHSGLLFQFYDYELGGHGTPSVLIPYPEIRHLVRMEGLLGGFLKREQP